jgi:peptidyl-prolyl cis-trans isomerase D
VIAGNSVGLLLRAERFSMVMRVLREGAFGGFLKYVIMSLLALSVLGLVFMDVQGVLRGGVGGTDVARVGNQTIGLRAFDHLARMSLSRYQMSPRESYAKDPSVLMDILHGEVRSNQVLLESEVFGLSINDKKLQQELIARIKPSQQDGESLQQTLDRVLRSQGLSEGDFIESYNREVVGDVVIEAVQSGFEYSSKDLAGDLFRLQNHTREISLINFLQSDIQDVKIPDDGELLKIYEDTKAAQYKIDERRVLQVAFIDGAKLEETLDINEQSVQKYYDENIEQFFVSEQRLLEQAIVPNEDAAKKILSLVLNQKLELSEAKKKISPQEGTYVPSAPFTDDMLIADLKDGVFKAKAGDTVGPFHTLIGYHVITIKDVVKPHTKTFEDAKTEIQEELEKTELADRLVEVSESLEDILAKGTSFEEAAKTVPLIVTVFRPFTALGFDIEGKDVFDGIDKIDTADKDIILQEAKLLQEGETSRVFELPSGRFAALHLLEIIPESFKPFEDVKNDLIDQHREDQRRTKNSQRVTSARKAIGEGTKNFVDIAKEYKKEAQNIASVKLYGPIDSPLLDEHRAALFQPKLAMFLA